MEDRKLSANPQRLQQFRGALAVIICQKNPRDHFFSRWRRIIQRHGVSLRDV
jgi:hypothetical protein